MQTSATNKRPIDTWDEQQQIAKEVELAICDYEPDNAGNVRPSFAAAILGYHIVHHKESVSEQLPIFGPNDVGAFCVGVEDSEARKPRLNK